LIEYKDFSYLIRFILIDQNLYYNCFINRAFSKASFAILGIDTLSLHDGERRTNRATYEKDRNSYTVRLRLTSPSIRVSVHTCVPIAFPRPLVNTTREKLRNHSARKRVKRKGDFDQVAIMHSTT